MIPFVHVHKTYKKTLISNPENKKKSQKDLVELRNYRQVVAHALMSVHVCFNPHTSIVTARR